MSRLTWDEMKRQRDGHLGFGRVGIYPEFHAVGEIVERQVAPDGSVHTFVKVGHGVIEYVRTPPAP